jgi:peptide/nickel transport system permease protein
MLQVILSRAGQSIGVLFAISVIVFVGINLVGDPVLLLVSPEATQADVEHARQVLGLDQPIIVQYWLFLGNVLHGDLGNSFISGRPALGLVLDRLPATLELALAALLLAITIGVPLGIVAGYYHRSLFSRAIMVGSIFGFSVPGFWIGLVLIMLFAVELGWLPSGGRGDTASFFGIQTSLLTADGWLHLVLPAINLALFKISLVIRVAAAGTREAMALDYVRFARAKGLNEGRIVFLHIGKNIMIPVVTVLGLEFSNLIAFSVVTESVFRWPGMGKLLIDSIQRLDRPVVVAYMILICFIFIAVNFVVDLIYTVLNPRIRVRAT